MIALLLVAAVTVLPADRLVMADSLFNKGKYAGALAEYEALKGESSVAADELLYRLAECERALGRNEDARKHYAEVFVSHADSKHADRSRFMYAMGSPAEQRQRELRLLDSDRVAADIRAAALYNLGSETGDPELLERCVKVDPKGRYAVYADLKRAMILGKSEDAGMRRKGVELLLGVAFGSKNALSEEALYLAGVQSYRDKRYAEASSLFRRYLKTYPQSERGEEMRAMAAWSDYMSGRYADAAATCGDGKTDDLAYVRAACAYAMGDDQQALELFRRYLADFPQGRYRADAELPIARIEFKKAEKAGDSAMIVESAKRGFGLSRLATDQLRLAWAYEKANRSDEAKAEYQKIAQDHPKTDEAAEALYRKAMIDAREEHWEAADLALSEALATGRCGLRKGAAQYWHGVAATRLGHDAEGVKSLKEALETGLSLDEAREARLLIADYDLTHGREAEAKAAYEKLIADGACERMSAAKLRQVGRLLGGDSARACARALIAGTSAEWRQVGYALLGSVEEKAGSFAAAIEAYRKCLAEQSKVAEVAEVSLRLGILEARAGEHEKAEETLKRAVVLNGSDASARALAYVTLAENSAAKKDFRSACAYATVVVTLFGDGEIVARAKKILSEHPEESGE